MTYTRVCKVCGMGSNDLSLFAKDKGSKHGRRNLCKECSNKKNRAFDDSYSKKKHLIQKRYGISYDEYMILMSTSDKCEICGSQGRLCYDHDHTALGKEAFRGVLCSKCNKALGALGDNSEALKRALRYLERYENGIK